MKVEEAIIIGAGPCGLSAGIFLQEIGLEPLLIEKNVVVHSIYMYPTYMHFFSTPELLEIGGIPFTTPNEKPSRLEALHYYRNVAQAHKLRIRSYEAIESVTQKDGLFQVSGRNRYGDQVSYLAKRVIVATGYFDHPNRLGIPGEELPKVSHFYREAHPYTGSKVAIIGGNNSAVDAAMELLRVEAEVTIIYRGADYSPNIKPWVRPTFESLVNKGRIKMHFESQTISIDERSITIRKKLPQEGIQEEVLENDFVLALTGFRPDRSFLSRMGIDSDETTGRPIFNPETMETNVPGLYLAGVIAAGNEANEIFIETGRFHGRLIASHIQAAGRA